MQRLQDAIIKETLTPDGGPDVPRLRAVTTACVICRVAVAGNTTMNHLLLGRGRGPRPHGAVYPDASSSGDGLRRRGPRRLPVNPDAPSVLIAPNIGSYVGGDITAGALTSLIWDKAGIRPVSSTSARTASWFSATDDFMMSCACSAGPAFEGGDISCGMRATDGAVEAVRHR